MRNPKVTIIIPYSKDRGYLKQAEESVENQTYDGEIEVIHSSSPHTVGYNINRGIERATGDYIKYLCDDDMLTPWSIEESVKSIELVDFIHGKAINFWEGDKRTAWIPPITNPDIYDMLNKNVIHGGTLMYKRSLFDNVGMFDESLDCAEEYEFNLRCLSKGMKLGFCDSFLYMYRRHTGQKSLGNKSEEYQEVRQGKIQKIKDRFL